MHRRCAWSTQPHRQPRSPCGRAPGCNATSRDRRWPIGRRRRRPRPSVPPGCGPAAPVPDSWQGAQRRVKLHPPDALRLGWPPPLVLLLLLLLAWPWLRSDLIRKPHVQRRPVAAAGRWPHGPCRSVGCLYGTHSNTHASRYRPASGLKRGLEGLGGTHRAARTAARALPWPGTLLAHGARLPCWELPRLHPELCST